MIGSSVFIEVKNGWYVGMVCLEVDLQDVIPRKVRVLCHEAVFAYDFLPFILVENYHLTGRFLGNITSGALHFGTGWGTRTQPTLSV